MWIVHRPRTLLHGHEDDASYELAESECCVPAPSVIAFNQAGDVVESWGGPGSEYEWPLFRGQSSSATDVLAEGTGAQGRLPQRTQYASGPPLDYPWPESEHTITLDDNGNVWIGKQRGLARSADGRATAQHVRDVRGALGRRGDELGSNVHGYDEPSQLASRWTRRRNELYVADGYGKSACDRL